MSPVSGLDLTDLARFTEALARAPEALAKLKQDLAVRISAGMEAVMRDKAPKFEGTLAQSLTGRAVVEENRAEALVTSDLAHAAIVETGRRPGRMPPAEPIRRWVELKLLKRAGVTFTESELDGMTYVLQRHIARHGTKGSHYIKRALAACEPMFERELERFGVRVEHLLNNL